MQENKEINFRNEYGKTRLEENFLPKSPMTLFEEWMELAVKSDSSEPNAMTLATVSEKGFPSVRVVLLKSYGDDGFVFFTNYESRKGIEIQSNPNIAFTIYWEKLERQVRVEGIAVKTSRNISENYFLSRPIGSQISAIISPQSKVIPSRSYLDKLKEEYVASQEGQNSCPDYWGGFLIKPQIIEFWQGRESRLHDRIRYKLSMSGWRFERLAP